MNFEKIIAVRNNKTVYKDADCAIKVFCDDFSKASVLNEALNQARVEETDLNIPQLLEVSKIDGKWAITTQYIHGKTLASIMRENPDKQDMYLDMLVELQTKVHSCRVPQLTKLKDKLHVKIEQADLDATVRYDLHTRIEGIKNHSKLCHGDFNPSNIIITPEGDLYILDWSHATQGNASADAAKSYLLFTLANENETAEKYLKLFCQKSGIAVQYIKQWLPIAAAAQLAQCKPDDRRLLLKWINVVDYE